jgi:predicted RNase H-like HicB family nuclease
MKENTMQTEHASNGNAESCEMEITITPKVQKDGDWYVAVCPEVPEANGQGRTREECLHDLKQGVISVLQDRREDAASQLQSGLCAPKPA